MPYSKLELASIRTGIGRELAKLDNVIEKAEGELRDATHRKRNLISRLEKMDEADLEQGRKAFWERESLAEV